VVDFRSSDLDPVSSRILREFDLDLVDALRGEQRRDAGTYVTQFPVPEPLLFDASGQPVAFKTIAFSEFTVIGNLNTNISTNQVLPFRFPEHEARLTLSEVDRQETPNQSEPRTGEDVVLAPNSNDVEEIFTEPASKPANPPMSARFLLSLVLAPRDRECIEGDLIEEYRVHVLPQFGAARASVWFWTQALTSVGPVLARRLAKVLSGVGVVRLALVAWHKLGL
jgi:hypothetical protein